MTRSGQTFLARKGTDDVLYILLQSVKSPMMSVPFLMTLGLIICLMSVSVPFPLCDYWVICEMILEGMWTSYPPVIFYPMCFSSWWSLSAPVITLMILKWWFKNSFISFKFVSRYSFIVRFPAVLFPFRISLWSLDSFKSVLCIMIILIFHIQLTLIWSEGREGPFQTSFCVFSVFPPNALTTSLLCGITA